MNPAEHEETIFSGALLLPAPERGAYLDRVCGKDAELRRRMDQLLESHETGGLFLEEPAGRLSGGTVRVETPASEKLGDRIGRYKLLEQIGEGGCGIVYVAEQEEPVRRRVALKIIKLGMDTKQVIARFDAERQALAMMDHPNIAKILDAGITDAPQTRIDQGQGSEGKEVTLSAGRPYFVMELVRGIK